MIQKDIVKNDPVKVDSSQEVKLFVEKVKQVSPGHQLIDLSQIDFQRLHELFQKNTLNEDEQMQLKDLSDLAQISLNQWKIEELSKSKEEKNKD